MVEHHNTLRRYACSVQPHLPAAAFCTSCRRPYAGRFLSVLPDGRAVCYRCMSDQGLSTISDAPKSIHGEPALEHGWVHAVIGMMRSPRRILGTEPFEGSLRPALLFGFAFCLIGAVLPLIWPMIFAPDSVTKLLSDAYAKHGVHLEPSQIRLLILSVLPIAAAVKLFLGGALLYLGVRVAVGPEIRFREQVRAFALSTGVLIFGIIPPPFGLLIIAVIWGNSMMKWLNARYGISPFRGMLAILPALLMMSLL